MKRIQFALLVSLLENCNCDGFVACVACRILEQGRRAKSGNVSREMSTARVRGRAQKKRENFFDVIKLQILVTCPRCKPRRVECDVTISVFYSGCA